MNFLSSAMLKFGSKSDVNVTYKCTVRLLEDTEIVECDFQVSRFTTINAL